MKGRNVRRVSPCQSHLRERCWKNVIFHTAISGGGGKGGEILLSEGGGGAGMDMMVFVVRWWWWVVGANYFSTLCVFNISSSRGQKWSQDAVLNIVFFSLIARWFTEQ